MLVRALGAMAVAVGVGGCAETGSELRRSLQAWSGSQPVTQSPKDPVTSGRAVARSVWGVVPSAPRRKADLRPELISGSAVAVAADTLLANCAVTGGRARVGLVRHNKYRIARVSPDAQGQVCRLTVAEGPLIPASGWRSFADLRVGEPVLALASRSSAEVTAVPGFLAGKGDTADPFLEATPTVPAGNRSAVLVDGFGNLIGLGTAATVAGGLMLAVPMDAATAASLANRDLGAAEILVATLSPTPRAEPAQPPILLALGSDERDSRDRTRAARTADLAANDRAETPAPGATADSGGSDASGGISDASNETEGGSVGTTTDAGTVVSDAGGAPSGAPTTGETGGATAGGTGTTEGSDDRDRERDRRERSDDDDRSERARGRGDRDQDRSRDDDDSGRGRGRGDDD